MHVNNLLIDKQGDELFIKFYGKFDLYLVSSYQKKLCDADINNLKTVNFDLRNLDFLDTSAAIFIHTLQKDFLQKGSSINVISTNKKITDTLNLTKYINQQKLNTKYDTTFVEEIGKAIVKRYDAFLKFVEFFGLVFVSMLKYISSPKNIRYKEIFFEINESAIKAFWII